MYSIVILEEKTNLPILYYKQPKHPYETNYVPILFLYLSSHYLLFLILLLWTVIIIEYPFYKKIVSYYLKIQLFW